VRAFRDNWAAFGLSVAKLIIGSITSVILVNSLLILADAPRAASELQKIMYGTAATVATFVLIYLFFLARAPARMEAEAEQAHAAEKTTLSVKIDELNAQVRELKDTVAQQNERHAAEKAALHARRAEPGDVLERFTRLAREGEGVLKVGGDRQGWLQQARQVVRLALRYPHPQEFDELAKRHYGPDTDYRRAQECISWLHGWHGKLTADHISPECTADKLRATEL
jgi:hypothetical protein